MIYVSSFSSMLLALFCFLTISQIQSQKFNGADRAQFRTAAPDPASQKRLDEAIATIREDVSQYQLDATANCKTNTCCKLSTSQCNLSSLPKDKTSLIFPGGETRCIFSYSTEYSFQVVRGDSDKVLLYFQGGGACWDEVSTNAGFCSTDAVPYDLEGLFDHSNTANPYKSYTAIVVLYCSGDLHCGDVTRSYTDDDGVPVQQMGIKNVNSVLDWIATQQANGQLASSLTDLVVMGCSAGSIGAQIWSEISLSSIQWSHAAVIPDSYAGVFPEGTQGPLIYGYGACEIVDESLQESCEAQTLTLQDITDTAMQQIGGMSPAVPFSFIQSKEDAVQISFYIAVGALTPDSSAAITPEQFYAEVNEIFERYNDNSIFTNYMVNGNKHCFTNSNTVYKADTTGPTGSSSSGEISMVNWVGEMPLSTGTSVATECYGELLSQPDWTGTTYCDAALADKTCSA